MQQIKPYNPNQKGGSGETLVVILIIGAVAYFGYRTYQDKIKGKGGSILCKTTPLGILGLC
jgi:predicted negative regulator of RcsB-dependent stress response